MKKKMKRKTVGKARGTSFNKTEQEVAVLQQDMFFVVTQHITGRYNKLTGWLGNSCGLD